MKSLLLLLGGIWSYLYPYTLHSKIKIAFIFLYTGYYSSHMKAFGKNSVIKSFAYQCGLQYVSVGKNCSLGRNIELTAWDKFRGSSFTPKIIIGDNVHIRNNSQITAINSIFIGKRCFNRT